MPNMVEIGKIVLEKGKKSELVYVLYNGNFHYFASISHCIRPCTEIKLNPFNQGGFVQFWFKLAEWNWRNQSKCDKFMMTDKG